MASRIEISRDIAASPEAVYAAISDVTRMGEWSEECHTCEWRDDADGPAVGATFDGHNRNGDHEWTSQGKVSRPWLSKQIQRGRPCPNPGGSRSIGTATSLPIKSMCSRPGSRTRALLRPEYRAPG